VETKSRKLSDMLGYVEETLGILTWHV
jgi:hypothetical protein